MTRKRIVRLRYECLRQVNTEFRAFARGSYVRDAEDHETEGEDSILRLAHDTIVTCAWM